MRHDPAGAALIIMLRSLKMPGMALAVQDLHEQGSPAFEAAMPILSQLLKAEMAERGECPIFCVSVIWSMLPKRSKDDDDFERTAGRAFEGLRAA